MLAPKQSERKLAKRKGNNRLVGDIRDKKGKFAKGHFVPEWARAGGLAAQKVLTPEV